VRDAAGELDVLNSARYLTLCIGQHLAVFRCHDRRKLRGASVEQFSEGEENGRPR
jgi:hypothetical protein